MQELQNLIEITWDDWFDWAKNQGNLNKNLIKYLEDNEDKREMFSNREWSRISQYMNGTGLGMDYYIEEFKKVRQEEIIEQLKKELDEISRRFL